MREFIRHPSDIPIHYRPSGYLRDRTNPAKNVSQGGISFRAPTSMRAGETIRIAISAIQPPFEATASVVWCRFMGDHFEVGVRFADAARFSVRMVEQICHIEHYRRDVERREARTLSSEEAAREWISKYAAEFPR